MVERAFKSSASSNSNSNGGGPGPLVVGYASVFSRPSGGVVVGSSSSNNNNNQNQNPSSSPPSSFAATSPAFAATTPAAGFSNTSTTSAFPDDTHAQAATPGDRGGGRDPFNGQDAYQRLARVVWEGGAAAGGGDSQGGSGSGVGGGGKKKKAQQQQLLCRDQTSKRLLMPSDRHAGAVELVLVKPLKSAHLEELDGVLKQRMALSGVAPKADQVIMTRGHTRRRKKNPLTFFSPFSSSDWLNG